ncbi:hypothetical protein D9611_005489 [Ephemerocybe angulata]|uniref:Integrase catalytic domain-containing protein n=1 Tax=Ephemerocybe angulata TaxID=980116 RepID=A0A8H5C2M0_9AGAR|nr:hypothetical protein D9611_005489 [Tulosesus angulatus]
MVGLRDVWKSLSPAPKPKRAKSRDYDFGRISAWTYEEWWLNDDVVHYIVTSRLDPSIATSVPKIVTMANGTQAKATSRDVWNYIYRTYGAGQITTTLSAWAKATSKSFTAERLHEVEAYILEFRRAYDAMVVAGQSVSYESVQVTLADALPDVGGIASLVREFRAGADAQTADHPHVALEKVQLEVSNYLAKHPRSSRSNVNNNNKKSSGGQSSGGGRNRPWCETCNTSGHWTRFCFQRGGAMEGKKEEALKLSSEDAKKAKGQAQGRQGGGASGGGARQGVAAVGVGATSSEAGDAPPAAGPGHDSAPPVNIASVVVDTQRNNKEFECYVETAMLVDKEKVKLFPPGCEYLLDSGCTSHIINDRKAFWDFEDVPTQSMMTANCGSLGTRGRGTIKLTLAGAASDGSDLVLVMRRALYSPDAPCSLISVGTLQEKGVGIDYLPAPSDETYIRFGSLTPWNGLSVKASRLGKLSFVPGSILYPPGAAASETTPDEPSVVAAATSDDTTVSDELRAPGELTVDEESLNLAAANMQAPTPHRWHQHLGHLGRDKTKQFLTGTYATGVSYSGPFEDKICPPCVVGKGARAPIPNPGNHATKPLERLHLDICGPHEVMSLSASRRGRFKYWMVILDDFTNYSFVALLPDRTSAGVLAAFTKATARWELLTGEKVKCVRMDGAKEFVGGVFRSHLDERGISVEDVKSSSDGAPMDGFVGGAFRTYLEQKGIEIQETAPYQHEQNGKAERYIRTIQDDMHTLLAGSLLPTSYWADAVLTAVYVQNRCPTSTLPANVTPFERMYGSKPDVSNLRVFGCLAWLHIPSERKSKDSHRREPAIFVGYDHPRKGWWFKTLGDGSYKFTDQAIFDENTMGHLQRNPSPTGLPTPTQPSAAPVPPTQPSAAPVPPTPTPRQECLASLCQSVRAGWPNLVHLSALFLKSDDGLSVVWAWAWPEAHGLGLAFAGLGFQKCQAKPTFALTLGLGLAWAFTTIIQYKP